MRVFISWSGEKSKEVAKLLSSWLKSVIQSLDPWMSEDNIESGAMWFKEICDELKEAANSIVVVTKDNKKNPWIMFEAGAACKGDNSNRVTIFAVDLRPEDIPQPLGAFNCIKPNKEQMRKLIGNLNDRVKEFHNGHMPTLDNETLNKFFEKWYPDFEEQFKSIMTKYSNDKTVDNRTDTEKKQDEILASVRSIERAIVETKEEVKINTASNIFSDILNTIVVTSLKDTGYSVGTSAFRAQVHRALKEQQNSKETQ